MKNTCPFCVIFQVLKVRLIKTCKIEPPDLLFIVVLISFYISKHHFSQIFRTLFNIYLKKDFRHKFFFFNGFTKASFPHPLNCENPLSLTKFFVVASLMVKSKLPTQSGSHSGLETVEPHP